MLKIIDLTAKELKKEYDSIVGTVHYRLWRGCINYQYKHQVELMPINHKIYKECYTTTNAVNFLRKDGGRVEATYSLPLNELIELLIAMEDD